MAGVDSLISNDLFESYARRTDNLSENAHFPDSMRRETIKRHCNSAARDYEEIQKQ
jgi:hypothetical protein